MSERREQASVRGEVKGIGDRFPGGRLRQAEEPIRDVLAEMVRCGVGVDFPNGVNDGLMLQPDLANPL